MTQRIGLFYGSTTCYSEIAAEKIQAQFAPGVVELHNIKDVPLAASEDYEVIIFGLSTWDFGEIQEDWESHWSDISSLQLGTKIVALYGMGDQVGYTDWFQDALGTTNWRATAAPATAFVSAFGPIKVTISPPRKRSPKTANSLSA